MSWANGFQTFEVERFIVPPSLKCRLSIVSREVRQALDAEHCKINDSLLNRCIDVAVGSVGTCSPVKLVASAYTLYKQQLKMTDLEKMRAARKHFAVKYLDKKLPTVDRIYCFIFFKLLEDSSGITRRIREVIRETSENNFALWRDKAYSRFSLVPPVIIGIKPTLTHLFIASLQSLLEDNFALLKENHIDAVVVHSEFAEYGFDVEQSFSEVENLTLINVQFASIMSFPMELFAQIQKVRSRENRVCIACDTDGLTISGLIAARYFSLATCCSHEHALKSVKMFHESFFPQPYALEEFNSVEFEEEESKILDLQMPLSESQKDEDRRLLSLS